VNKAHSFVRIDEQARHGTVRHFTSTLKWPLQQTAYIQIKAT